MSKLPWLHRRGPHVIDESGRRITLRGINFGGWLMMEGYMLGGLNTPEHIFKERLGRQLGKDAILDFTWKFRNTWITKDDVKNVRRLGFNCVRLPFNYQLLEKQSFQYDAEGFQFLDRVLSWFEEQRVYVILDLHAAPGSQNPDWHSDSSGRAILWTSPTHRKRTIELWGIIAERYANRSVIAGYDLLNESVVNDPKLLNAMYREIVAAIRSVDTQHIVILEGNHYGRQLQALEKPFDENIMYSIHHYAPVEFTFHFDPTLTYPGAIHGTQWDRRRMEKELTDAIRFSKKNDVPIFVGEFGISSRCAHCHHEYEWVRDCLALFKKHHFHWTYWTYKSVAGSFFPDGLYQLLPPINFVRPHESTSGLDALPKILRSQPDELFRKLETRSFQLNAELAKILHQ